MKTHQDKYDRMIWVFTRVSQEINKTIHYNPLAPRGYQWLVDYTRNGVVFHKFYGDFDLLINEVYNFIVEQDKVSKEYTRKYHHHTKHKNWPIAGYSPWRSEDDSYEYPYNDWRGRAERREKRKARKEMLPYARGGELYRCAPLPNEYPFWRTYGWRQGKWPWYNKTSQIYKVLWPNWIDEFGRKHRGKSKGSRKIWDDTYPDYWEPNKHTFMNKSYKKEYKYIARHYSIEEIKEYDAEKCNSRPV